MRGGAWVVVLCWVALASPVRAQSSGASFGGSSGFGSSSGSSSSSSSSGSGSSSSSSSTSTTSASAPEETPEEAAQREAWAREAAAAAAHRELVKRALELPPAERAQSPDFFRERMERPRTELTPPSERGVPEPPPTYGNAGERGSPTVAGLTERGRGPHYLLGLLLATCFVGLVLLGGPVKRWHRRWRERPSCEVRRFSIAFDWSERPQIQRQLEAEARQMTPGPRGFRRAARQTVGILLRALPAARSAMFSREYLTPSRAEPQFFAVAQELKARYRHDVLAGGRREHRARAEEGQGMVVVSVVLGSTQRLRPLPEKLDVTRLSSALASTLPSSEDGLVALEVIWSPAAEDDRMSSLELEKVYPELLPIEGTVALGARACVHCSALRAAEIPRCPVCGAPDR